MNCQVLFRTSSLMPAPSQWQFHAAIGKYKFIFVFSLIMKEHLGPLSPLGLPSFQVGDFWLCETSSCLLNPKSWTWQFWIRFLTRKRFINSQFLILGFFLTELNHFQNLIWWSSLISVSKINLPVQWELSPLTPKRSVWYTGFSKERKFFSTTCDWKPKTCFSKVRP